MELMDGRLIRIIKKVVRRVYIEEKDKTLAFLGFKLLERRLDIHFPSPPYSFSSKGVLI